MERTCGDTSNSRRLVGRVRPRQKWDPRPCVARRAERARRNTAGRSTEKRDLVFELGHCPPQRHKLNTQANSPMVMLASELAAAATW
ncbi:hypothetical protein NDU88_007417 [Pleurodeles waltl]|uniref:Uncharacterized protein n=1 Tax=Pleurodeles waltl TaxID=8319 RepID=A0AAV7N409_PLEWA|nr:hypothetical protein NDU88_007417 [Pleurodeles waltl]